MDNNVFMYQNSSMFSFLLLVAVILNDYLIGKNLLLFHYPQVFKFIVHKSTWLHIIISRLIMYSIYNSTSQCERK